MRLPVQSDIRRPPRTTRHDLDVISEISHLLEEAPLIRSHIGELASNSSWRWLLRKKIRELFGNLRFGSPKATCKLLEKLSPVGDLSSRLAWFVSSWRAHAARDTCSDTAAASTSLVHPLAADFFAIVSGELVPHDVGLQRPFFAIQNRTPLVIGIRRRAPGAMLPVDL